MDEYVKSDASRKRKWDCDGEMEAKSDEQMSAKRHKSMIETNQQFGAGRVEPKKEKNPQQENEEILEQSQENDSHQVEPEKEKNPQQENGGGVDEEVDENNEYVDRSAFNEKLYARQFKPTGKKDIYMAGKQYKVKIESLIRQQIEKSAVSFFKVY